MLRATFVRTAGQPDRVYVVRPDGTEVAWPFPTYGDALPHDLVHLVVESAAGLRAGFWGKVASGIDPRVVNAAADGGPGTLADKYRGFGELDELVRAEFLAAYPWRADDETRAATLAGVRARMGPGPVTEDPAPAMIAAVAATLDRLEARWRTLVPRGSLVVEFDPGRPRLDTV